VSYNLEIGGMVASGVTIPVMTINGSKTRSMRRCIGEPVFNRYMPIISFALFGSRAASRSIGRDTPNLEILRNPGLRLKRQLTQCGVLWFGRTDCYVVPAFFANACAFPICRYLSASRRPNSSIIFATKPVQPV
jgi:hypothetical protein